MARIGLTLTAVINIPETAGVAGRGLWISDAIALGVVLPLPRLRRARRAAPAAG